MKSRLQPIHFILFLGLALRLLSCYEMSVHNPLFDLPIVDSKEYVDDATFYNDVNWLGAGGSYFHPPGYSYFIGVIFLFFGKSLWAIRLVQIGMDIVNIYLLFLIAQKIFDKRVALLSALLYAIYVRSIQYSAEILPPVFVIFLLLMSLYCLIPHPSYKEEGSTDNSHAVSVSLSAFFLGLLIITLPNFLLVIPVFLLWIFLIPGLPGKQRTILLSIFLIICLFPTFLTALRNRLVADEGLLISRNGGINFFIGNNPDIKKTVGATPGIEWDKLLMIPYKTERTTNFQEQDDFFNRKAFEYVKTHPVDWIKLMGKKTLWFFNAYEFPRNFDVYHFAEYSFVTKYPLFNLSILFPLALAGMLLAFKFQTRSDPGRTVAGARLKVQLPCTNTLLLLGIIIIYSFSIILIFIAARYRLPVIPLMIIFAASLLMYAYDLVREKKIYALIAPLLLVASFTFITQKQFFFEEYPYKVPAVFTNTLLANTLINAGQKTEGAKYLQTAIALPTDEATDDACYELAHYYRGLNEKRKAKEYFYRSVELDPGHYKSWNSLGFDLKMEGNFPEAIACLRKGIEIAPCFPELYLNLADCYLVPKKIDSAIIALRSYYTHCPSPHPNISENLGKIYMDILSDFKNAAACYEEAILYPQGFDPAAETYNRLGACHFKLGAHKKAKEVWKKGLEIDPGNKAIRTNVEHARLQIEGWDAL